MHVLRHGCSADLWSSYYLQVQRFHLRTFRYRGCLYSVSHDTLLFVNLLQDANDSLQEALKLPPVS